MDDLQFLGTVLLIGWFVPSPISIIYGWWKNIQIEKEKARFKETYSNRVELESRGLELLKTEAHRLRQENENLRITVKSQQNKPGRAELRQLYVYDAAVTYVLQKLPQFMSTWQEALKLAEEEMIKKETGSMPWLTKIFRVNSSYELGDLQNNQKQIGGV